MTTHDERLRAVEAHAEYMRNLLAERWPKATDGKRKLRSLLKHFPDQAHLRQLLEGEQLSRSCPKSHRNAVSISYTTPLYGCPDCRLVFDYNVRAHVMAGGS